MIRVFRFPVQIRGWNTNTNVEEGFQKDPLEVEHVRDWYEPRPLWH